MLLLKADEISKKRLDPASRLGKQLKPTFVVQMLSVPLLERRAGRRSARPRNVRVDIECPPHGGAEPDIAAVEVRQNPLNALVATQVHLVGTN